MIARGRRSRGSWVRRSGIVLLGAIASLGATGCGHMMMMVHGSGAERPAESEFGYGPRASQAQLYSAVLEASNPLRPRQMHTVRVAIADAQGRAVEGAAIQIDGGMPQHNHGLPTQPRVTKELRDGRYEIEGVRFNMGGWWEFKLAITSPAGSDTLVFNLDI